MVITGSAAESSDSRPSSRLSLRERYRARLASIRTKSAILATFIVLVVVTVLLALIAPGAAAYYADPARQGTSWRTVAANGTVNPVLTVAVSSSVSGVIQRIYCDYNTKVTKGQLCAQIDARPYQTAVDQDRAILSSAKAQLEKDEANLNYAKKLLSRYATLLAQGAASQDLFNSAMNGYSQAKAQVDLDAASVAQHAAALKSAEVYLEYTNIVSPIDGTILSRNVTVGQTIAANFQAPTLFVIASDLSRMQIDANVSEREVGAVRISDRALVNVEAFPNHTFDGVVTQVRQTPQKIQNVVTYDVVVSIANRELLFKSGMTATVHILLDRTPSRIPSQLSRILQDQCKQRTVSGDAVQSVDVKCRGYVI